MFYLVCNLPLNEHFNLLPMDFDCPTMDRVPIGGKHDWIRLHPARCDIGANLKLISIRGNQLLEDTIFVAQAITPDRKFL